MLPRLESPQVIKKIKVQNRLIRLSDRLGWDAQRIRLVNGYSYGLVSLEGGIIYLSQLKAIYKTLSKYIKPKRRLSKRRKAELARTTTGSKAVAAQATKRPRKRKKYGRILLSIFPSVTFTKKGLGTRMGKGKGGVDRWGVRVRAGRCLFQIKSSIVGRHALYGLYQVQLRLPILTRLVVRNGLFMSHLRRPRLRK